MNRFITKGTIRAGLSIALFLAATTGHKQLSAILSNHEVVEGILAFLGIVFGISAGMAEGVQAPDTPTEEATFDYTGWKWDAINGWVHDSQETRVDSN
jgi:hypothetical protein